MDALRQQVACAELELLQMESPAAEQLCAGGQEGDTSTTSQLDERQEAPAAPSSADTCQCGAQTTDPQEIAIDGQPKRVAQRALAAFGASFVADASHAANRAQEPAAVQGGPRGNMPPIPSQEDTSRKVCAASQTAKGGSNYKVAREGGSSSGAPQEGASPAAGNTATCCRSLVSSSGHPSGSRMEKSAMDGSWLHNFERSTKCWADMVSEDEEDEEEARKEPVQPPPPPSSDIHEVIDPTDSWTWRKMQKVASRRIWWVRTGGGQWRLTIDMSGLVMTEKGMVLYCKWLSEELVDIQRRYGKELLHRCHGEVNFSHCCLSDDMVCKLLEVLKEKEVHVAYLKLFSNRISQSGILAISELIMAENDAEAILEIHLSHNEIEDEAAVILLQSFAENRKYPPRRSCGAVPVWLRLNHNRIADTRGVVSRVAAEGLRVCMASDRHLCGTRKCWFCPSSHVHLYSFWLQRPRWS